MGSSSGHRFRGFGFIGIIWGFPKIRGTFLGVPMMRTIVYWGLYWGSLILGNYPIGIMQKTMENTIYGFGSGV